MSEDKRGIQVTYLNFIWGKTNLAFHENCGGCFFLYYIQEPKSGYNHRDIVLICSKCCEAVTTKAEVPGIVERVLPGKVKNPKVYKLPS